MFPDLNLEAWEACHFNPDFPELDTFKEIVKNHGKTLFQPFDREGLRVQPLKLKVNPAVSFCKRGNYALTQGFVGSVRFGRCPNSR